MDQAQQIVELQAENAALKQAVKDLRKIFINLMVITKEAGATVKQIADGVLGMEEAIADVKKRFDFKGTG